jgi:hypothetical protein
VGKATDMNDSVIFRKNTWPDEAALERAAGRTVVVEADLRKV